MKRQCLSKCKSTSGASLVLALLLFLICAAVGSVVLTAATASVGRVSQKKELLHKQEALRSAAQLIDSRMTGTGYMVEGTWSEQGVSYASDGTGRSYMVDGQAITALTALQDAQRIMAQQLFSTAEWTSMAGAWQPDIQSSETSERYTADTNVVTRKKSHTLSVGTAKNIIGCTFDLEQDESIPPVNVQFSMDNNGDIEAELSCGEAEDAQTLKMTIKAEPIQKRYDEVLGADRKTKVRQVTYTINWEHAAISYGG